MITIVKAIQTSMACPSQWDAWDADGNYYYLRYRHGCGSVEQYESENWVDAPWVDEPDESQPGWALRANTEYIRHVTDFNYGDGLDGSITLEDFARLAGVALAPDAERTAFWRHTMNQLTSDLRDDPAALARADQFLGGVNLDEE